MRGRVSVGFLGFMRVPEGLQGLSGLMEFIALIGFIALIIGSREGTVLSFVGGLQGFILFSNRWNAMIQKKFLEGGSRGGGMSTPHDFRTLYYDRGTQDKTGGAPKDLYPKNPVAL